MRSDLGFKLGPGLEFDNFEEDSILLLGLGVCMSRGSGGVCGGVFGKSVDGGLDGPRVVPSEEVTEEAVEVTDVEDEREVLEA